MDFKPELVNDIVCELGEGPVWDTENASLCWVEIVNGKIHEWSPKQGEIRELALGRMIGAIALCRDGGFVAALQDGFALVDRRTGKSHALADPEVDIPGNRFNDGKCDPNGRFWAGTMSLSETDASGSLYSLSPNGTVTRKLDGLTISNGMAWSTDGKRFYLIDSPTRKVFGFDYDKVTGNISARTTVIELAPGEGSPDGMTIDDDGMLWVAHWGGWQVSRWNPWTGKKLLQVKLPVSNVTSCTFGGSSLDELYITTARKGLSVSELGQQPNAGRLFKVRLPGITGSPAVRFANAPDRDR